MSTTRETNSFFFSFPTRGTGEASKLCEYGAVTLSCSVSVPFLCAWAVQCVSCGVFFTLFSPIVYRMCEWINCALLLMLFTASFFFSHFFYFFIF